MTLEGYLLVVGAIMTLLVTSRPAMKALRDYGTDLCHLIHIARRAALADVILEAHNLAERFEEHESDTDLHPAGAVAAAAERRNLETQ